jgi:hypothetical protein
MNRPGQIPAVPDGRQHYDEELCSRGIFADNFCAHVPFGFEGFEYTQHRQQYGDVLFAADFCGGTRSTSSWMSRDDILRCLRHFGFANIRGIAYEDRASPRGPSFCLVAAKA